MLMLRIKKNVSKRALEEERRMMMKEEEREKRMQTYPVISSDISAVYNRVSILMRSPESPVIT